MQQSEKKGTTWENNENKRMYVKLRASTDHKWTSRPDKIHSKRRRNDNSEDEKGARARTSECLAGTTLWTGVIFVLFVTKTSQKWMKRGRQDKLRLKKDLRSKMGLWARVTTGFLLPCQEKECYFRNWLLISSLKRSKTPRRRGWTVGKKENGRRQKDQCCSGDLPPERQLLFKTKEHIFLTVVDHIQVVSTCRWLVGIQHWSLMWAGTSWSLIQNLAFKE